MAESASADTGPPLYLAELDGSASFMLRMAELAAYEAICALDPDRQLSLPEQTVMIVVAENPEARQGAVADRLRIRWPNMTKLVRRLEDRGLVERVASPDDRRGVRLRATQEGARMAEILRERLVRYDDEALPMLEKTERAELIRLLRKVAGWPPPGGQGG